MKKIFLAVLLVISSFAGQVRADNSMYVLRTMIDSIDPLVDGFIYSTFFPASGEVCFQSIIGPNRPSAPCVKLGAGFSVTDLTINTGTLNYTLTNTAVNTALGYTPYNASNPAGYVSGAVLTSALASYYLKPAGTTAQYVRGDGTLATLGAAPRTFTSPTRALNSAYQISATQDSQVSYSLGVEVAGLLSVTAVKCVGVLEYADNAGMTTNVVQVDSGKSGAGGLINLANSGTIKLVGGIPAGKYVRLRTVNTGTPTVTLDSQQEVLQ